MPDRVDERMFLPGILSVAADDAPRQVYADYLDESTDESDVARAEFIRLQLQLNRIGSDHPNWHVWNNREKQLLLLWQTVWAGHLGGWVAGYEFHRGMLDTVCVDARWFCECGHQLFEHSAVRKVRFLEAGPVITRLAACPALEWIRELDLCGNDLGNGGVNLLLRSPQIWKVELLDLSFNGLDDGAVTQLARSPNLRQLHSLSLNDNRLIGCAGVIRLADSQQLPRLRNLDLSGNDIADAGVAALVGAGNFHLHSLRLHANRIGDAGAKVLAGTTLLARMLVEQPILDLRDNRMGAEGVREFGAASEMDFARGLDFGGNELRDDGVRALVEGDGFKNVRRVSLRQNRIGDPGARRLANSALMEQLDWLDVSENRIAPAAVALLWAKRKDFRTAVESAGQFG